MSDQLVNAIADMEEEQALAITKESLEQGVEPMLILEDCRTAMQIVGKRFEEGQ